MEAAESPGGSRSSLRQQNFRFQQRVASRSYPNRSSLHPATVLNSKNHTIIGIGFVLVGTVNGEIEDGVGVEVRERDVEKSSEVVGVERDRDSDDVVELADLNGISAQELFLWFPVKAIRVDVPSSGLIYFDVGVVDKQFSLSLFESPPDCTALDPASDDQCGDV